MNNIIEVLLLEWSKNFEKLVQLWRYLAPGNSLQTTITNILKFLMIWGDKKTENNGESEIYLIYAITVKNFAYKNKSNTQKLTWREQLLSSNISNNHFREQLKNIVKRVIT